MIDIISAILFLGFWICFFILFFSIAIAAAFAIVTVMFTPTFWLALGGVVIFYFLFERFTDD
jgi:hypothetical protein